MRGTFSDSSRLIDRREAVRRTVLALGGLVSAPTLAGLLAGCEAPPEGAAGWTPRALTNPQGDLVALIAEHIIPATDTPGARAAGVHRFIDVMLAEYYTPAERAAFLSGLADVDQRAHAEHGRAFGALPAADQQAVLAALDREAYAGRTAPAIGNPHPQPHHFFRTMKELTLLGYYTSQVGATQELKYARVPGRFDGCIPFASVGRAWSV